MLDVTARKVQRRMGRGGGRLLVSIWEGIRRMVEGPGGGGEMAMSERRNISVSLRRQIIGGTGLLVSV